MLNLNEDFKIEYERFLYEEFDKEMTEFTDDLEEAYNQTQKSFQILEDYFDGYWASARALAEEGPIGPVAPLDKPAAKPARTPNYQPAKVEGTVKDDSKQTRVIIKNANKGLADILELINDNKSGNPETDITLEYQPEVAYQEVQKVSEMKFPKNIIFFIKSLISWCKNLVIALISKLTNLVRRVFNLPQNDDKDKFDLKFKTSASKDVEKAGYRVLKSNPNSRIDVIAVSADKITHLDREFFGITEEDLSRMPNVKYVTINEDEDKDSKDNKKTESSATVYGLKIDISNDLDDLRSLVNHFFNIFDNAYGSNGEYLFGTQDLELLLKVFQQSIDDLVKGKTPTYEVQGMAKELVAVDKGRLRVNLEKTLMNTENLKKVYAEIESRIQNTLKIISHKELIAAADMGVAFQFYSASTYRIMDDLIKVITPRIKDAKVLEKNLTAMKKQYEELTIRLGKLQQAYNGLSGITYQTIQQRTISNLFESAQMMTRTVTLRLTTLSLYLKCLKDVRESIANVNAVNYRSRNALSNAFSF